MVGIIKEIDGQKKIVPLTSDTGTGAPVGTLISQYKKVPMSGYLYCDGSTFDQNAYPALYMYLGTNVLPDYRECVMVGAEQNTTDTIATHDVYGEGEFKDDQLQEHKHMVRDSEVGTLLGYGMPDGISAGVVDRLVGSLANRAWEARGAGYKDTVSRYGTTTHGKQKAVYVYIKATSGLAENQQENVLNDIKRYLVWNYKVVSCVRGERSSIDIPADYNGNYEYSVYDYNTHASFHGIHITSDGTTTLGNIATNHHHLCNDEITLNSENIIYAREKEDGGFRIAFRPIPNGIAI